MKQEKETKVKSKRKANKKLSIFFLIMGLVYISITAVFCTSILKMDLLPGKYIAVFCIVEVILTILILFGLILKHKTRKLNIFCLILAIIISALYLYATRYANATTEFLSKIFNEVVEVEEYYIIVEGNSEYNKISDLKEKDIYVFQTENDVKNDIEGKTSTTLLKKDSLVELGQSLIDKEIEAIVVSLSQYNMLGEEIENFELNTRVIYTTTHKIKKNDAISDENTKYNIANDSFNIYISGMDTKGNINNVARSDANIIVTVNTKTHEVLLTSIPRDYYVKLHSKKAKDKLTHSGLYGITETVTTVEDLLDIDINYYVRVNFTTVIDIIDTIGKIEVYSDYDFDVNDPWEYKQSFSYKKGINYLSGEAALAFSRERYSFVDGDNQRIKNQQKVIEAIMKKVLNSKTLLTKYTSLLESLEGSFQTNIKQSDISKIVKDQLDTMPSWTIKTNSLVGSDAYESTYTFGRQELYVMKPDEDSVAEATEKINEVLKK